MTNAHIATEQDIEMAAARDAAVKRSLPSTIPEHWRRADFITPTLPAGSFGLFDKNKGVTYGSYRCEEWVPGESNTVYTHNEDGSPMVLRVLGQDTNTLQTVNDDGLQATLVIVPIRDNILEADTSLDRGGIS